MRGPQIPYSLFFNLYDYFVYENDLNYYEIREALIDKMQRLQCNRLYSKSKTAADAEEREKAFQEYLKATRKIREKELNIISD